LSPASRGRPGGQGWMRRVSRTGEGLEGSRSRFFLQLSHGGGNGVPHDGTSPDVTVVTPCQPTGNSGDHSHTCTPPGGCLTRSVMKKLNFGRRLAAVATTAALALAVAGCGSSDDDKGADAADGKVLNRTIKVAVFPTFNGLTGYV